MPMVVQLPAKPLFPPGQVVMTDGVSQHVECGEFNPSSFLARHFVGDWGDLCPSDKKQNDRALKSGEDRLFSSYNLDKGYEDRHGLPADKLWIITEWDRSVTTLLFPSEY
ncbi:MAG: hypothetical protein LBE75_05260 [Burkholderiales bacterium]|nr:hypothetical protein [Burkholderiales bacterium]